MLAAIITAYFRRVNNYPRLIFERENLAETRIIAKRFTEASQLPTTDIPHKFIWQSCSLNGSQPCHSGDSSDSQKARGGKKKYEKKTGRGGGGSSRRKEKQLNASTTSNGPEFPTKVINVRWFPFLGASSKYRYETARAPPTALP